MKLSSIISLFFTLIICVFLSGCIKDSGKINSISGVTGSSLGIVNTLISTTSIGEESENLINLTYTDLEEKQAISCTVSSTINMIVTTACSCTAGVCTVGLTGDLNIFGSMSFDYNVSTDSETSKTSSVSFTINNTDDAPVLAPLSNLTSESEGLAITTVNASDLLSGGDTDIDLQTLTYSCFYEVGIDGSVASTTSCTSLTGVSFNTSTGEMDWTPNLTQEGSYEFKIIGSDGASSDDELFSIIVVSNIRVIVNFVR